MATIEIGDRVKVINKVRADYGREGTVVGDNGMAREFKVELDYHEFFPVFEFDASELSKKSNEGEN